MLDLLVLALVLGHGLGFCVGLARVLEALLHRAEELAEEQEVGQLVHPQVVV